MKFGTQVIHIGQEHDETSGSVVPPINLSSNFIFDAPGKPHKYEYTRVGNPNSDSWEAAIAAAEAGKHGLAYASGMAAMAALLWLVAPKDHVLFTEGCYGGTHRLFDQMAPHYGIETNTVDTTDISAVESAIRPNTRLIVIETPTNPLLGISDIKAISQLAKKAGALVAVDNTFLSPYYQRPLTLGADITMHSSTKYLGGHSDILGGALVVNDDQIAEKLRFTQSTGGGVPSPFSCWLLSRSVKTLELRMQRHNANAIRIAHFLSENTKVEKVNFAGLPDHPQHELAKRQQLDPYGQAGYGGMISFTLQKADAVAKLLASFTYFKLAESLGGVESLICHPASMTHAGLTPEARQRFGIGDNLLRMSVGVENIDDLIADIDKALATI